MKTAQLDRLHEEALKFDRCRLCKPWKHCVDELCDDCEHTDEAHTHAYYLEWDIYCKLGRRDKIQD